MSTERVRPTQWAELNDLHPFMLPFGFRAQNPVEVMQSIRSELDALPKTAMDLSHKTVGNKGWCRTMYVEDLQKMFELNGCWIIGQLANGTNRYANPNYLHLSVHDPITGVEERKQFVKRVAGYGTWTLDDVAVVFGIKPTSVRSFLSRQNIDWLPLAKEGRRRLARTLKTIHNWTAKPMREVAALVNVDRRTVYKWLDRHVENPIPESDPFHSRRKIPQTNVVRQVQ